MSNVLKSIFCLRKFANWVSWFFYLLTMLNLELRFIILGCVWLNLFSSFSYFLEIGLLEFSLVFDVSKIFPGLFISDFGVLLILDSLWFILAAMPSLPTSQWESRCLVLRAEHLIGVFYVESSLACFADWEIACEKPFYFIDSYPVPICKLAFDLFI